MKNVEGFIVKFDTNCRKKKKKVSRCSHTHTRRQKLKPQAPPHFLLLLLPAPVNQPLRLAAPLPPIDPLLPSLPPPRPGFGNSSCSSSSAAGVCRSLQSDAERAARCLAPARPRGAGLLRCSSFTSSSWRLRASSTRSRVTSWSGSGTRCAWARSCRRSARLERASRQRSTSRWPR